MAMDLVAFDAANQPVIHVIATTFAGTRAALGTGVPLAKGSGAKLIVVVPRIVPYAAEANTSSGAGDFFVRRYERIVAELGGAAQIDVCLCRSLEDVVAKVLATTSTIVVGGPAGRWLTSPEERFANWLSRFGRRVVFVACGPNTTQRRVAPTEAA
jgi:3D (Asp-Asp-Asp) domain-containing protein